MRVLIVEEESNDRQALRIVLETMGHDVDEAASGRGALRLVERQECAVAFVDLCHRRETALEVVEALRTRCPRLVVIAIAASDRLDTVIEALRRGAVDYVLKPFLPDQVRAALERVLPLRPIGERVRTEAPEAEFDQVDPQVQKVLDQARHVALSDAIVLICGESGTGKRTLARAIHHASRRARGPFVTVVCPGLSPAALESDLFGHAQGATASAVHDADGKIAVAEGGTLFLDEVGDSPAPVQSELVRFFQERYYERVGETALRAADVRVVAATRHDLEAAVAAGTFRPDLLYCLNVIELMLPPLRHRSDIAALADRWLAFLVPDRPPLDELHARGSCGPPPLFLAGKPPRTAQRGRAGRPAGPWAGGRSRGSARTHHAEVGRFRRPHRGRRPGQSGTHRDRTHPPGSRPHLQPGGSRAGPQD